MFKFFFIFVLNKFLNSLSEGFSNGNIKEQDKHEFTLSAI